MIVIPQTFRGISAIGIVMMIASIVYIGLNSKDKTEYRFVKGQIVYLDKKMGELPSRDRGIYRYLIIDTYSFPFEIYADDQAKRMDSLNIGDSVTIFFYETESTESDRLNRYAQFIEKEGKDYFRRTEFHKIMGFVMVGLSLFLIVFAYALWKAKKIDF